VKTCGCIGGRGKAQQILAGQVGAGLRDDLFEPALFKKAEPLASAYGRQPLRRKLFPETGEFMPGNRCAIGYMVTVVTIGDITY